MGADERTRQLEDEVRTRPLPAHVAVVMDGNGRWAELRGRPRVEGHREGSNSVREVTRAARRLGVRALTLYAFSSQNWSRPPGEVAALMELLREYLESERAEIMENGIRFQAIGQLDRLPDFVREPLEALRRDSAANTGLVLTLALSYGGREEILNAARLLCERARAGELDPANVDEAAFESCLWTHGLPPLDLVVRTSGELRLSNFLLWQAAYSEFIFTETLWPDFRGPEFVSAIAQFQTRERRFGMTGAQVKQGA